MHPQPLCRYGSPTLRQLGRHQRRHPSAPAQPMQPSTHSRAGAADWPRRQPVDGAQQPDYARLRRAGGASCSGGPSHHKSSLRPATPPLPIHPDLLPTVLTLTARPSGAHRSPALRAARAAPMQMGGQAYSSLLRWSSHPRPPLNRRLHSHSFSLSAADE